VSIENVVAGLERAITAAEQSALQSGALRNEVHAWKAQQDTTSQAVAKATADAIAAQLAGTIQRTSSAAADLRQVLHPSRLLVAIIACGLMAVLAIGAAIGAGGVLLFRDLCWSVPQATSNAGRRVCWVDPPPGGH